MLARTHWRRVALQVMLELMDAYYSRRPFSDLRTRQVVRRKDKLRD